MGRWPSPCTIVIAVHEMPGNIPLRYVSEDFTKPALRSVAAQRVTAVRNVGYPHSER